MTPLHAHYPEYQRSTGRRHLFITVEKLLSFDYVRETLVTTSTPYQTIQHRKRPYFGEQHGGLIAYAVVGQHRHYLFEVLIWWHKHHDRDIQPDGVYKLPPEFKNNPGFRHWGPCEAVPPQRVLLFFPELTTEGC